MWLFKSLFQRREHAREFKVICDQNGNPLAHGTVIAWLKDGAEIEWGLDKNGEGFGLPPAYDVVSIESRDSNGARIFSMDFNEPVTLDGNI